MKELPSEQSFRGRLHRSTVTQQAAAEASWLAGTLAAGSSGTPDQTLAERREARIRERAYFRAEQRGFASGHAIEDWLEAEREVDEAASQPSGD